MNCQEDNPRVILSSTFPLGSRLPLARCDASPSSSLSLSPFPPFFHTRSFLIAFKMAAISVSCVCVFGSEAIRPSFFLSCYYTVFLVRAISSCVVVLLLDFATLFL